VVTDVRLGIDFGTSTTVAVLALPDGRTRPLLIDSSPLLSSAVHAGPAAGDPLLTGVDAENAALGYPAGLEPNPKRRVADGTVWLGERELHVGDLFGAVLGRVAAEARRVADAPLGSVVLTHPVSWGPSRMAVLAEAARSAGLGEVAFVAEPVAAARYFTTVAGHRVSPGRHLLVYDLGAGTFDVTAIRPSPTGFEVAAAAGLDDVGGLDLDAVVVGHARTVTASAAQAWQRLDWPQTPADRRARHALWRDARAAKERLSRHAAAELRIPLVDAEVHLTRDEFEAAARAPLARTVALTLTLLREAAIPREALGGVFLVGGSARIPLVATLLHQSLQIAPVLLDQPELAVAEGSLLTGPAPADPVELQITPSQLSKAGTAATGTSVGGIRLTRRSALVAAAIVTASAGTAAAAALRPGWLDGSPADPGGFGAEPDAPSPRLSGLQFRAELTGHEESIQHLAFSPSDGNLLASAATDATVRLWQVAERRQAGEPLPYDGYARGVAFSPDGRLLAGCGNDYGVRLWDVTTRQQLGDTLSSHESVTYIPRFTADGRTVISCSADDTIRLWDVASRRAIGEPLLGHSDIVYTISLSPRDPGLLASGGADRTVRLWDLASREQLGVPLAGHTETVGEVVFSPDGTILAAGDGAGEIWLWDVALRTPIGEPLRHPNGIGGLVFSIDGTVLISSGGSTIRLWDVARQRLIGAPIATGGTDVIHGLVFSPDGATLASVTGSSIYLWDPVTT
jgi:hypothetical protein